MNVESQWRRDPLVPSAAEQIMTADEKAPPMWGGAGKENEQRATGCSKSKRSAALRDLFAWHWIAAGAALGHSIGIHGTGGAALSAIRVSSARDGNGRFTSRRSWICSLRLARSRLPILGVRFLYAGTLGVSICTEQHRCRRQTYYPFHRMPSLYNFRFNSERGKKCRSCAKFRARATLHQKEMHSAAASRLQA
jgi:hypothetical protein